MNKQYIRQLNIWIESGDETVRWKAQKLAKTLERENIAVCPVAGNVEQCAGRADGILWMTDSATCARQLAEKQLPVIAWLHEGNRSHSFATVRYAVECPEELDGDFFDKIYRRYAGIPWDILETDRCLVRETTVDDVAAFVRIYQDPAVTRYTEPFCREPQAEREYVKEYIEKVYDFYGYGVWTVLWKESGEVIGRVGFEQAEPPALGYMIAPQWQGKGIAYEVCRAVLQFAREELGMEKIQVRIHRENAASIRVAEKLGVVREEKPAEGVEFTFYSIDI